MGLIVRSMTESDICTEHDAHSVRHWLLTELPVMSMDVRTKESQGIGENFQTKGGEEDDSEIREGKRNEEHD